MPGWMNLKVKLRLPGTISTPLDVQMTPPKSEKELKMKVKEESEKTGLKLNIQKTSSPITSWQIDGETMEIVTDFILGGSKIIADGD